jgi:beta-galactosidase
MKKNHSSNPSKSCLYKLASVILFAMVSACTPSAENKKAVAVNEEQRERISINDGWKFFRYGSREEADKFNYDIRPAVEDLGDDKVADSKPTEAVKVAEDNNSLKNWILPSGNRFIKDPVKRYIRPVGDPGSDFPFVKYNFDDSSWESINLPHDWAIKGPFLEGPDAEIGGGMGRLPINGVAWYRRKLDISDSDRDKKVFLETDGAMSYAMVWVNGHLAGGWPYGYNSWYLDITPYLNLPGENQFAIRIDNPPSSSRWYPGAGLYRNMWIIKTNPVHVAQWGTFVSSSDVSAKSATVNIKINIDNDSEKDVAIDVETHIYHLNNLDEPSGENLSYLAPEEIKISAGKCCEVNSTVTIKNPKLWGPPPTQKPNRYEAITILRKDGRIIDSYHTPFGIRSVTFDPDRGIIVNGEKIQIRGVNQHHDLGALGTAFNERAAERQLEILREMGCNAIRLSHNPPAPELLDITDRMGFLVVDEIFDTWEQKKTSFDFHLIFPEWYEQDTRAFICRDRNHPSVIIWSFGNEVGEQYTGNEGAIIGKRLHDIIREEDPTRPSTISMNYAKPDMPLPPVADIISLNYQGEGIRDAAAYAHLQGIHTPPLYDSFHEKFPGKLILSSETASALSTRGTFLFPVFGGTSAPVSDGSGGDPDKQYVSSYELYTSAFGASPDKVFAAQDRHPFVAGEFVWSGWDYLGEPTPYYSARSSYSGIIDLAGFKKDRFYLYQSRWRPDLPSVHILPHWTWPGRNGMITPVHVFTSGDEAELFLNGKSLGRRKMEQFEYRLRWDSVIYEPGELKVIAFKNGRKWAEEAVKTAGNPSGFLASPDRKIIHADGKDLSFITIVITDSNGETVPCSDNLVELSVQGPGEIIATDNGNPADMTPFPSHNRKAFNGMILVIIRSEAGKPGTIQLIIKSAGLKESLVTIKSR